MLTISRYNTNNNYKNQNHLSRKGLFTIQIISIECDHLAHPYMFLLFGVVNNGFVIVEFLIILVLINFL